MKVGHYKALNLTALLGERNLVFKKVEKVPKMVKIDVFPNFLKNGSGNFSDF